MEQLVLQADTELKYIRMHQVVAQVGTMVVDDYYIYTLLIDVCRVLYRVAKVYALTLVHLFKAFHLQNVRVCCGYKTEQKFRFNFNLSNNSSFECRSQKHDVCKYILVVMSNNILV